MPRIIGVEIPPNKRIDIALRYIYGIGPTLASRIVAAAKVSPETRVRDLTDDEVTSIRENIDRGYTVEGDLRREVRQNIQRLIEINCYRGMRHRRGLPVHGQRTRTNARTKRGARRTVAGKRRSVAKK